MGSKFGQNNGKESKVTTINKTNVLMRINEGIRDLHKKYDTCRNQVAKTTKENWIETAYGKENISQKALNTKEQARKCREKQMKININKT